MGLSILMIKTIFFDLDGVLVDSREIHFKAFNQALKEIYNYEIDLDTHNFYYNGLPTKVKLKKLITHGIIEDNFDKLKQVNELKQKYTLELIKQEIKPKQNILELLKWLDDETIVKLWVVTNAINATTLDLLSKSNILQYIGSRYVTNEDVKNPKPHPEGFIRAMVSSGTLPENALIVEDSDKGIEAANLTGATVLRINSPDDAKMSKDYFSQLDLYI